MEQGKQAEIVEMTDPLASRMLFGNRCVPMVHLDGYGVTTHMESTVTEIRDGAVIVQNSDEDVAISCDNVVISIGDKPDHSLVDALGVPIQWCQASKQVGRSHIIRLVFDLWYNLSQGHKNAQGPAERAITR